MNNNEQLCKNCGKPKEAHQAMYAGGPLWCNPLDEDDKVFKPKPTPDPKLEQVAKRPERFDPELDSYYYGGEFATMKEHPQGDYVQFSDFKALEAELRVYKRALEFASEEGGFYEVRYLEAARKEQQK